MEGREGLQLEDLPRAAGCCCSLHQDLRKQTRKIFKPSDYAWNMVLQYYTNMCAITPSVMKIINCSVTEVDTYLLI